jgi:hypothetical protein
MKQMEKEAGEEDGKNVTATAGSRKLRRRDVNWDSSEIVWSLRD